MTTPNGNIVFNNLTGSDTQASGLGPSTAVFGSTGSCTSSSAIVTGIDTTGVSAGDLFWGDTSSGRQFSIIASVDSGSQVTLDDTLSATHSGDLVWAIGGKRAILDNADSRTIFASTGAKAGWTIDVEETGTDYTLTSVITMGASGNSTDGYITIKSSSSTRPIIKNVSAPNTVHLFSNSAILQNYWRFEHLELSITGESGSGANSCINAEQGAGGVGRIIVKDCILRTINVASTGTAAILIGGNAGVGLLVEDCYIEAECIGIRTTSHYRDIKIFNSRIFSVDGAAIELGSGSSVSAIDISGNIIKSTSLYGIISNAPSTADGFIVLNNNIYGCGSDGIRFVDVDATHQAVIMNNNITHNGGYGINLTTGTAHPSQTYIHNNNFGTGSSANTSGDVNGVTKGDNNINVDPQYVDAAGDNFSVGTNVKAKGRPLPTRTIGANQSDTVNYVDIGAAQRQEQENVVKWFGLKG